MPYAGKTIDTHCHVFRAKDLPVKQFLIQVKKTNEQVAAAVARISKSRILAFLLLRILGRAIEAILPPSSAESYIKWARLLTRSNKTITKKMTKEYDRVVFFTPLMMDMIHWMGGKQRSPSKQVSKMVGVMNQTMKKKPIMVHPFVPFDPERERKSGTSLPLVKDCIEKKGFIGVKLYPPLGFQATENSKLVATPNLISKYVKSQNQGVSDKDLVEGWDKALDSLYKYCSTNDVPITAHCTDGGAGAYGELADPKHWDVALQKYPKLHLNLAHFGGDLVALKAASWAWAIGGLMQKYDHVYADTGAHKHIYEAMTRNAYLAELKKLFAAFPKAPKRYMYGTDWHMIIRHGRQYEDFYEAYTEYYDNWYAKEGLTIADFFFNNAFAFLGLKVGEKTHTRLLAYYKANPKLKWPMWLPKT